MKLIDKLNLRGEVLITGTDSVTGKTTTFVDDKNLIVLNGRRNLASLLYDGTGVSISKIVVGIGGTAVNNPVLPLPVDPEETILISPLADDPLVPTSKSALASPRLTYIAILPAVTSYNGYGLNEIALMLSNGSAFAIKRFGTITKSTSLSLKITWTIYL